MSDTKQHHHVATNKIVEAIAGVWKQIPEDKQSIIKAEVADLDDILTNGSMPEARASANVRMVHADTGAEVQFTMRGWTDDEVENRVIAQVQRLTGAGWTSKDQAMQVAYDNRKAQAQTSAPPIPHLRNATDGLICQALELLAMPKTASDTTLMWKVRTDKSQYPTPFYDLEIPGKYPETVAALTWIGIDTTNFILNGQPAKHALSGWIAEYILKEDGKFPKKITKLIPPTQG